MPILLDSPTQVIPRKCGLDNNSIPEEILKAFNRDYRSTFLTTGIFFIPAGIFPTAAWCHHIFLEGERAATLILARESEDYFSGARHCYEQFVPFVQEWIEVNRSEDFAYHLTASFARLLDGNMDSLRTVARGLAQRGWTPDSSKKLVVAAAVSPQVHFDAFVSQSVSRKHPGLYGIPFQKKIVVLCNLELICAEDADRLLRELMDEHFYYGVSSVEFRKLRHTTDALRQCVSTLKRCQPFAGRLYSFSENVVGYISDLVEAHSALPVAHPLIEKLESYDRAHRTEYSRTLFCYLRNERNHQRTSAELSIHRNTLSQRIEKLREIWDPKLDDPQERFYLLYSFYAREPREKL